MHQSIADHRKKPTLLVSRCQAGFRHTNELLKQFFEEFLLHAEHLAPSVLARVVVVSRKVKKPVDDEAEQFISKRDSFALCPLFCNRGVYDYISQEYGA